jgi:HAD superfamily hydrolase (TIGR01509 family)
MSIKRWDPGTGPAGPVPGTGAFRFPFLFRTWRYRGPKSRRLPGAVLFDMDGLLIDSEPLWTIAENELAESLGGTFTPEIKAAMIGKRLEIAVPILLAGVGRPDADPLEAGEWLLSRMTELFAERLPLQPGAQELLDAVRQDGVPAALVSSSYRRLVDAALQQVGADRFAVSIAGDEVENSKPDPEPYVTAAGRLGVPPRQCVVLEDSEAGARSAVAAGCPCVVVPTFPVPPGPWRVVNSLREITLEGLATL